MSLINGLSNKTQLEFAEILGKVTKEIYDAGFADGRKSVRSGVVPVTKSPNQQRAELIQRAREFVEEMKVGRKGMKVYISGCFEKYWCSAEFVVNAKKRTVVCLLKHVVTKNFKHTGIAKCHPNEVFNADIGKAIALARALEIDVPEEFLQAVQPDERVVGMVVEYGGKNVRIAPSDDFTANWNRFGTAHARSVAGSQGPILDDTNAIYEEESK